MSRRGFLVCVLLAWVSLSWLSVEGCEPGWLSPGLSVEDEARQLTAATSAREGRRIRRAILVTNAYENLTPSNRTLCPETAENKPPNRVDTAEQLGNLREAMGNSTNTGGYDLAAYFIPYEDQHGSGGSEHDKRLKYISGFSGSNGYAWVTKSKAGLWTDGRYFLQGDQEMDCNWILMKMGEPGYPSSTNWLIDRLPKNSMVGADPKTMPISTWQAYQSLLNVANITLVEINNDLIDQIWTTGREPRPNMAIYEHTMEFAGKTWQSKIDDLRVSLGEVDVMVITALDETAWLFNLRGADRPNSPLFYSYGIISKTYIRLYLINPTSLLGPIQTHLNTNGDGSCTGITGDCVNVRNYDDVITDIRALAQSSSVGSIWITPTSSYAVYSAGEEKLYLANSPIQLMKSIKNDVEKTRYRECQVWATCKKCHAVGAVDLTNSGYGIYVVRDSAALVEFVTILEKGVKAGQTNWTEVSAANYLTNVRSQYDHYKMDSFPAISGVGPNGAVIHYRATVDTDTTITTNEMYLLDSGGNYLDGTTDVTRTFHFGTPTDEEKEAYTRVLMGAIELANTVWRSGLRGSEIDARARSPLWQHGWDYNHGTGHGIGYFLNVHEGPIYVGRDEPFYMNQFLSDGPGRINLGYDPNHSALYPGMFFSDEPGYYEDGKFGVRLETIVGVVEANTANNFGGRTYLTFDSTTLVPFEPNLIKYDLLETSHRIWLNEYNRRCREETGKYLQDRNKDQAYQWIVERTEPLPVTPHWDCQGGTSRASYTALPYIGLVSLAFIAKLIM